MSEKANRYNILLVVSNLILLLAVCAGPAGAAITYVDAVEGSSGNTYATGGSLSDTSWVGPDSSSNNDTQWNRREGVGGNNSTLFQGSTTADTLPELTTRITGLAPGIYRVWAFYWDQIDSDTQNWVLSAGVTSGSLTTYSSPGEPAVVGATTNGVIYAGDLAFAGSVAVDGYNDGNPTLLRQLFGINLGLVTVSTAGVVNVYVDNYLAGGGNNRAWYDGVGVEAAPITYVDAVEGSSGNTYATGGSLSDTSWLDATQTSYNGSQWVYRSGYANSETVFQAMPDGDSSGIPEITTEITGLESGIYNIWAFFVDNTGDTTSPIQDWVLSAGLTSGSLTTYHAVGQGPVTGATDAGVYYAGELTFSSPIVFLENEGLTSERSHFGIFLGQVKVSGGSPVNIYLDMLIDGNSGSTRVWYDGVGYSKIADTVNPGTMILLM